MEQDYNIMERRKGKHLTFEERLLIQIRLKDGFKAPTIAKEIGCTPNTVRNEIKRGQTGLYHNKVFRYKAKTGQTVYEENRNLCGRKLEALRKKSFLDYVQRHVTEDKWSLDVCAHRAILSGEFTRAQTLCTRTLYNYVDLGLLSFSNIDLPERVSRRLHAKHVRENKRSFGRSIEDRPLSVDEREDFGHWEIDLVLGKQSGEDESALVLIERKTRHYLVRKIANKESKTINAEMRKIRAEYGDKFNCVFKSITADNGSEFSKLSQLETGTETKIYFTHPYASSEKGSIERHNRILRRFLPKGKSMADLTTDEFIYIELWINSLPRKILGYRSPEELFEEELDKIYALAA